MPVCVAMLRGVNVGGKSIKMDRLRAAFEALGFSRVRTYVQSGNVVFESGKTSQIELADRIEKRILRDFDFAIPLIIKTAKEMKDVVTRNPFVRQKGIDPSRLHVTFLSEAPPAAGAKALEVLASKSERFHVRNREVYLYCPDGYGRSKLSNTAIERRLSVVATTRNWKTVNVLLQMAQS